VALYSTDSELLTCLLIRIVSVQEKKDMFSFLPFLCSLYACVRLVLQGPRHFPCTCFLLGPLFCSYPPTFFKER
jgi:hypothetical protein